MIDSLDKLKALLGPIDTANEAALILWLNQRPASCSALQQSTEGYWVEGEYMILNCPITTQDLRVLVQPNAESALGRYFAELAHLETAAVVAFLKLERDLEAYGAPPALLDRLRVAAGDEVRHASAMHEFRERFFGVAAPVQIGAYAARSLFELAKENATEGCVRETYGALVANGCPERSSGGRFGS